MMHRSLRLLSLILAVTLLLCTFCSAANYSDYTETAPDYVPSGVPTWSEENLTITSGSNQLAATMTIPDNTEGGVPMAILIHGMNSDRLWCSDVAWKLSEMGIATIRFDLAGFGDSTGDSADSSLSLMVKNILSVLDYAESLDFVNTDEIYLFGKSLGGVTALLAASGRQDEIAGLVLWYPGFVLGDASRKGIVMGAFFNPFNPPETVDCCGTTYGRTFLKECQSLELDTLLDGIDCPVCIVHGDWDLISPLRYSLEAKELLTDCSLFVIPGGTHGFYGNAELMALDLTSQWFSRQTGIALENTLFPNLFS